MQSHCRRSDDGARMHREHDILNQCDQVKGWSIIVGKFSIIYKILKLQNQGVRKSANFSTVLDGFYYVV